MTRWGGRPLHRPSCAMIWSLSQVWPTLAAQEHFCSDEHRSGASMCPACSSSTASLLALLKSVDRIPSHVIALEPLCSARFVRSPV